MDNYRYQLSVYCKDCIGDEFGCFSGGQESWGLYETIEEVEYEVRKAGMSMWVFTVYDGLKDQAWIL
jgi:hypothetical protein